MALVLAGLILATLEAEAQTQTITPTETSRSGGAGNSGAATPPNEPAVLTLKERLGAKWKDEQRVDNCHVPPEKRGPKPRPDGCGNASQK